MSQKQQNFVTAKQASNMRGGINIEGTATELGEPRVVNLKAGGVIDTRELTLVDDEGGEIKLKLWGDDIKLVQAGSRIKILNGYTNTFKGDVSLTKGKFGKLEVVS